VKGKLLAFETPARIALLPTPWTPENDMVTAAMKLKRVNIVAANKASLDAIYA
jgi:long-chain acyl-CoA synthetase